MFKRNENTPFFTLLYKNIFDWRGEIISLVFHIPTLPKIWLCDERFVALNTRKRPRHILVRFLALAQLRIAALLFMIFQVSNVKIGFFALTTRKWFDPILCVGEFMSYQTCPFGKCFITQPTHVRVFCFVDIVQVFLQSLVGAVRFVAQCASKGFMSYEHRVCRVEYYIMEPLCVLPV